MSGTEKKIQTVSTKKIREGADVDQVDKLLDAYSNAADSLGSIAPATEFVAFSGLIAVFARNLEENMVLEPENTLLILNAMVNQTLNEMARAREARGGKELVSTPVNPDKDNMN